MISELKESSSLKDIFKFYCNAHPEIAKFWKNKSKELANKYELETVDKDSKKKSKTEEKNKLLNKKVQRQEKSSEEEESSSSESEETPAPKKQEVKNKSIATVTHEKKEELKPVVKNTPNFQNSLTPVNNKEKTPFKRIDNSLKEILTAVLRDNSYEHFMYTSGDNYGREANEKLKVTKGRDFKKEKTKFKNKTGAGGSFISTEVRSIPLDVDSD